MDNPKRRSDATTSSNPAPRRERLRFAAPKIVPKGLWRRVPPAIFPPILGLLGLALAWRAGIAHFGLPGGLSGLLDGVAAALAGFALLAYGGKLARRPSVLFDDLKLLPGRAGLGAGVVSIYMLAAVISAYAPGLARLLLVAGLAVHIAVLATLLAVFRAGPPEIRTITPAWHLNWVGFIVAARAAPLMGWTGLAEFLLFPCIAMASFIWLASARQLIAKRPPAPLRPMLAIHLAPLALSSTVAALTGYHTLAIIGGVASAALLGVLILSIRWITEAGFSPLWGAFTFPLAATTGLFWTLYALFGGEGLRLLASVLLIAATLIIPPIVFLIMREWASGRLPAKVNAAIA
ncbi:MAG: tellurium resistance protein [Paracoccus sp. (in: a-proteobacteria)]|nr:tellurium resistance protein [Paracoccus sp. (in: a-proteobacteria)]